MTNEEARLLPHGIYRLHLTSGGTIPDRGLFGVHLVGGADASGGGTRVGELDEEMVPADGALHVTDLRA